LRETDRGREEAETKRQIDTHTQKERERERESERESHTHTHTHTHTRTCTCTCTHADREDIGVEGCGRCKQRFACLTIPVIVVVVDGFPVAAGRVLSELGELLGVCFVQVANVEPAAPTRGVRARPLVPTSRNNKAPWAACNPHRQDTGTGTSHGAHALERTAGSGLGH
jgi:hypothetical protein